MVTPTSAKGKTKRKNKTKKKSANVKHFGAKTYTDPKTGKKNTAF
jgi:hypothetical protein